MKLKDQQLLEEAYLKVNESHPHANPETHRMPSREPSLASIKAQEREFHNQERNAGLEDDGEDWKERTRQKDKQPGEPGFIYSKHGRKYIVAKSKLTNKVYPHSVEFSQGEEIDGERYEIFYKITGVDQQGYPISEPTGKKVKMLPSTEWGSKDVKRVPGFDD